MKEILTTNKFFLTALVLTIVIGGLTFANVPGPATATTVQTIGSQTFNFADYGMLDHEQLALFNYLDTIVSEEYQQYGSWNGWYAENMHGLHHYVLAFMTYAVSSLFETTSGYRTDYYREFAYDLIKKMNTTEAVWGNNSIEWKEWTHPEYNYVTYYYPNATHPDEDDVFTGGFRGPANIMWTGHYALMEALYERNFHTEEFRNELSWFVNDWNNSLLTDGFGNPQEGGIWETGLIPCEPYVVFVQCNSIPLYCTELYDNLYDTQYMEGGMWDYGLWHSNNIMQDMYSLFTDGYYVYTPTGFYYGSERLPTEYPGNALSPWIHDGRFKAASYCDSWALTFLEYTQEEETIIDYPIFLEHFSKEISGDQMYIMDSYNNPDGFGTYDILGSLFTLPLAKQRGDFETNQRIRNFLYSSYNKVWENNGREMHFDTMSLEPFLQSVLAFGWLWGTTPVTVRDLADARPSAFWDYPYISAADDDYIWVYQAEWDPAKEGFILNIRVDQEATLTFSNFGSIPTAYSGGVAYADLTASGSDYTLTLAPGNYYLVVM